MIEEIGLGLPAEPTVLFQREGSSEAIILNRPSVMNALNRAAAIALGNAVHNADLDPEVKVTITVASPTRLRGVGVVRLAEQPSSIDALEVPISD